MKIEKNVPNITRGDGYDAVELTMLFETEDELAEFYTLFNWVPITEWITLDHDQIRKTIGMVEHQMKTQITFNNMMDEWSNRRHGTNL